MSDRKDLDLTLPEWYRMELQTQKTMLKLSRVHELEFYLNHPDEYIRHQAILRLSQLRNKEALAPLNKIMDDPLEISINRDIAAWVLKSTGLLGNDNYYIGNHYLDRYTGNEKLKDFYYPNFIEDRTNPEYHFGSSGIEAMLLEATLLIRAESLEEKIDVPFSLGKWFNTWVKMKLETLRKGFEEIGKKSAAMLSGSIQKMLHPEKKAVVNKQKHDREKGQNVVSEMKPVHEVNPEFQAGQQAIDINSHVSVMKAPVNQESEAPEMNISQSVNTEIHATQPVNIKLAETQSDRRVRPEVTGVEWISPVPEAEDSIIKPGKENSMNSENKASVETVSKGSHPAVIENQPAYYMKPFTLKSCPPDKESRKLRGKSKIYVRGYSREQSFADAVKEIAMKLLKLILLPFVILWNQKLVFITLIVCLYLFFTFVPFGRMLFYRRSPELARMNDDTVKTAQAFITDKVAQLKEMASEYQLVRELQKRVVTGTQEEKTIQEPVRYIVTSKTLNLRKAPGTKAEKLLVLERNMIVEFLNQSMDIEEGKTWLYIQAPDGTAGWSFAGYLKKLEGGIEAYEGE